MANSVRYGLCFGKRVSFGMTVGVLFAISTLAGDVRAQPSPYEDRSIVYQPDAKLPGSAPAADLPIPSSPGPHLLLDDYLIADSHNVERVVMQPQRDATIPNPIVTGPEDRCFQPYMTVLYDPHTHRYRLWYGAYRDDRATDRSHLATMESEDGIHFIRPHTICKTPEIQFGSEVIDRGREHPDAATRYVYSYWKNGGLNILASPDGLTWQPFSPGVVIEHNHDITGIDWDPFRNQYVATVSRYIPGAAWTGERRTTFMSVSQDLIHWATPWAILTASDALDEGQTQFYAMDGYLNRGSLRIGMVKVLRDDLRATETEEGSFGRAHTSLAWSRDGRTWIRDRSKFFEPDDDPHAWDHAHAWIDEQLIVGDRVYLYYGGYKQGHKMNRFAERQIGLVRMPLDRYVARRVAARQVGMLQTVPFQLDKNIKSLYVNANAKSGRLRVQVCEADSLATVPGFEFGACQPVSEDGLQIPIQWQNEHLTALAGRTVCLMFELSGTDLFAFAME